MEAGNAYPNRPLWRSKNYNLLNNDLNFFGKAKTIVYLPDKPFDEENLGDTNAGVLFLLDANLQMTSFWWPLAQI